jgi:hypothetical protein
MWHAIVGGAPLVVTRHAFLLARRHEGRYLPLQDNFICKIFLVTVDSVSQHYMIRD